VAPPTNRFGTIAASNFGVLAVVAPRRTIAWRMQEAMKAERRSIAHRLSGVVNNTDRSCT
jgi:hypothetical protein